jgi:hypothetical protein
MKQLTTLILCVSATYAQGQVRESTYVGSASQVGSPAVPGTASNQKVHLVKSSFRWSVQDPHSRRLSAQSGPLDVAIHTPASLAWMQSQRPKLLPTSVEAEPDNTFGKTAAGNVLSSPRFEATDSEDDGTPRAAFRINRTLGTSIMASGHGFRDQTIFARNTFAYANFDAASVLTGTGLSFDHAVGFQSRLELSSVGGEVTHIYGYYNEHTITSGNAINAYGAYLSDAIGTGSISKQYGVFVKEQTKGAQNFAIYTEGSTPSQLGGDLYVDGRLSLRENNAIAARIDRTTDGDWEVARGFVDNTVFRNVNASYLSFDATVEIGQDSGENYAMAAGFHSGLSYSSKGGTLNELYDYYAGAAVRDSAVVTNRYGLYVNAVQGTGGLVKNNYGVFLASQSGPTVEKNWGVYQDDPQALNVFQGSTKFSSGITIQEGKNEYMGIATLENGKIAIDNTTVQEDSRIFLTIQSPGGTPGFVYISARVPGKSFTITSSSTTDKSIVAWLVLNPNN